jgi:16S rRNA (adenine1518-N6/adenine1519-N6)-dimethyltransferase
MTKVYPKKKLGQHFLKDKTIAGKISSSLTGDGYSSVLEIGPGMGILTGLILRREFKDFRAIEIDNESVIYLRSHFPELKEVIHGDFLAYDIEKNFEGKLAIIGNFPYNISSQILFRILNHRDKVVEVCCMLQKEVAERICSKPGSKVYGILSVLIQAFFTVEYLFTVSKEVFSPPPRILSGFIRLRRNATVSLGCDEKLFFRVVKASFNKRRKTLRNSVKSAFELKSFDYRDFHLRPEQLSVDQFVELTNWVEKNMVTSE